MSDLPMCSCAEYYESHHPECPVRRRIEALETATKAYVILQGNEETPDKKVTYWLYWQGQPIMSVRAEADTPKLIVRKLMLKQLEDVPGVVTPQRTYPYQVKHAIRNGEIRRE